MQTVRDYAEGKAFLEENGWHKSATDVMTFFRGDMKARIKAPKPGANSKRYRITYSKQRKK